MNNLKLGRRRFLKESTMMAGLSVAGVRPAGAQANLTDIPDDLNAYGRRSKYVNAARIPRADPMHEHFGRNNSLLSPLHASMGIITPNPLHFVTMHGDLIPDINPDEHKLLIHGMVERPLILTMDDLMRLPSVSRIHYLECQASRPEDNYDTVQDSHGKTSCAEWTGVLLSVLLQEVGVQRNAKWVVYESTGGGKMTKSLPMAKAMLDTMVAYGQNGEPVTPQNGYPIRMLVPGFEALYSVKWLRRIKLVDRPYMGYHEIRQYTEMPGRFQDEKSPNFNYEMGPKSVITSPSGGQKIAQEGLQRITGLAWSGGGAIRRVEVSTDNGRTWKDAEIEETPLRLAHTRFNFPWVWNGEETVILSRCTDEKGQTQPSLDQYARFWGTTAEQLLTGDGKARTWGHHNAIQPWGVRRDGSIYNAIAT